MSETASSAPWARLLKHSGPLEESVQKQIFGYLRPYVDAADIVHETLQYAYRNPDQWSQIPEENLIYYLRKISNFLIMKRARTLRSHREILVESPLAVPEMEVGEEKEFSPSKSIHKREKMSAVEKIFGRMKQEPQKDILRLVWFEGLSLKEAAARLGRSPRAASRLMARALETARQIARRTSFAGFRISGETT